MATALSPATSSWVCAVRPRILPREAAHVAQALFFAEVPEQHGEPVVRFVVEKHLPFPLRIQQVFVALGRIAALDQVGVVTEHHRNHVERGEVALLVLRRRRIKFSLRRRIGFEHADLFQRGGLFRGTVYDIDEISPGAVFSLNPDDLFFPGRAVGVHLEKWVLLAERPGKNFQLRRLQGAVVGDLFFGLRALDQRQPPLLRRKLAEFL
jgi:hypothetical protein